MNRTVTTALAAVDTIVFVIVAGRYLQADRDVQARLPTGTPLIVAMNKVDRLQERTALLAQIEELSAVLPARAYVPVSARSGFQIAELMREIAGSLPLQPRLYPEDQLTDRDERFFAQEYIREQLFRALGDELPYATAVTIDRFEERGSLRRIHATILVDKPSQRAIVIGEQGARLKSIASNARRSLEALYSGKVYLQVWVKVRRGWTDDLAELKKLGYV
jgi:GTP-binding protein Era